MDATDSRFSAPDAGLYASVPNMETIFFLIAGSESVSRRAMGSAERTDTSKDEIIVQTSDFPLPIPPVSPIRSH